MRTLSILLCSLLVLAPAKGQQAVQRTAPSFYVPYGVRDQPLASIEEYSSSDAELEQPHNLDFAAPDPQMCGHCPPMRRRQLNPYGNPYGGYAPPLMSSTAGAIVGLGIVTFLLVALATAHD